MTQQQTYRSSESDINKFICYTFFSIDNNASNHCKNNVLFKSLEFEREGLRVEQLPVDGARVGQYAVHQRVRAACQDLDLLSAVLVSELGLFRQQLGSGHSAAPHVVSYAAAGRGCFDVNLRLLTDLLVCPIGGAKEAPVRVRG